MRIWFDLTPEETAQVHGWKNYLDQNPGIIGTDQQWRILLSSRSRQRYEEVAFQFGGAKPPELPPAPPPLAPPPVITPEPPPPSGTTPVASGAPWNYPVVVREDFQWGSEFRGWVSTSVVTSFRLTVPYSPQSYGLPDLYLRAAEHGSAATYKQVCLSRTPGDFLAPIAVGQGNTAGVDTKVGDSEEIKPGRDIYFNIRFWSPDLEAPSSDQELAGIVVSGNWPR